MTQRKFRNIEERKVIQNEVLKNLSELGLIPTIFPNITDFHKILESFVENKDNGKYFIGVFKIPDLAIEIDYFFPGRRILQHYAKINKQKT